jgi:BON domain
VTSYAEKTAAERAARRVRGVKAIAEEIVVRLPSDTKRADDEIAARAVDILKWQVGVPADRIAVKVENGVVTPAAFQRSAAARQGRRIGARRAHRRAPGGAVKFGMLRRSCRC